jgi:hypothetical protein
MTALEPVACDRQHHLQCVERLVPISPNTTPSAARPKAARRRYDVEHGWNISVRDCEIRPFTASDCMRTTHRTPSHRRAVQSVDRLRTKNRQRTSAHNYIPLSARHPPWATVPKRRSASTTCLTTLPTSGNDAPSAEEISSSASSCRAAAREATLQSVPPWRHSELRTPISSNGE